MSRILLLLAFLVAANAPARADDLAAVAARVHDLELRRQLASATPATIDSLLALYADSVVYEHPNAGAIVRGKETMRRNMRQFIGSVRNVRAEAPRVTAGHSVAVIEAVTRMEIDDDGKWTPVVRRGIKVLEFDGAGKVKRILDYPW